MRSTAWSTTGDNNIQLKPSLWTSEPQAILFTTLTWDGITATPRNAPSTVLTSQPLCPSLWTPAFSGPAATHTIKYVELGLDPNCHRPFVTSPSHLLSNAWHQLHNNLLNHTHLHFNYYRYVVDNRFITHNEHVLHHPAIQTLIHPDFFGDPAELEPVDDYHLLGFNIDLTSRTITYIEPSQRWKIRVLPLPAASVVPLRPSIQNPYHSQYTYTLDPQQPQPSTTPSTSTWPRGTRQLPADGERKMSFVSARRNAALCVCPKGSHSFLTRACTIRDLLHATKL